MGELIGSAHHEGLESLGGIETTTLARLSGGNGLGLRIGPGGLWPRLARALACRRPCRRHGTPDPDLDDRQGTQLGLAGFLQARQVVGFDP